MCFLHTVSPVHPANYSDFAKRHPKIIEDERAVNVVLRMEETANATPGRRMTITNVGTQVSGVVSTADGDTRRATITTLGPRLSHEVLSPLAEAAEHGQDDRKRNSIHNGRQRADSIGESLQDPSPFTESVPAVHGRRRGPAATNASTPPHLPSPIPLRRLTSTSLATTDSRPRVHRAHSSREAKERRSSSLRRRSEGRTHDAASDNEGAARDFRPDFDSIGFEELMQRLAVIDSRLGARDSRIVDVVVEDDRQLDESRQEEEHRAGVAEG